MKNKIKSLFGSIGFALVLAALTFTVMDRLATDKAFGQASIPSVLDAQSHGDWQFTGLVVRPQENSTNVAAFYDTTGTNFTRFNPTNGGFWVRQQGSNSFAAGVQTANPALGVTNNTTGKVLVFINGLYVGSQ